MSTTRCPSTALVPDDFRPHIIIIIICALPPGGDHYSLPRQRRGGGCLAAPPGRGHYSLPCQRRSGGCLACRAEFADHNARG